MTAIIERRNARNRLRRAARRRVSAGLEEWLDGDEASTVDTLTHAFGEKILAAACLALMAPSALPIPTGGATHVFDVIALLFAAQMLLARRTVWVPNRWRHRELGTTSSKAMRLLIRFVKMCEKVSHRRLGAVMASRPAEVAFGAVTVVFVLAAMFSPPFTGLDTLPSLGVVFLALAILLEDVAFAIVGLVLGIAGIVLSVGFSVEVTHLMSGLFH